MRNNAKKILSIVFSFFTVVSMCMLAGCQDLGYDDYADYVPGESHKSSGEQYTQAYYESYGTVTAYYSDGKQNFEIENSLYNRRTVRNMAWDEDEGDKPVPVYPYVYLALPINRNMNISEVAMYVKTEKFEGYTSFDHTGEPEEFNDMDEWSSTVNFFLLPNKDAMPKKIKYFGFPDQEEIEIEDGFGHKHTEMQDIEYDDPKSGDAVGSVRLKYVKDKWSSFRITKWNYGVGTARSIAVSEGNILLLRFENNTGYNRGVATKSYFNFINLMIRVVS